MKLYHILFCLLFTSLANKLFSTSDSLYAPRQVIVRLNSTAAATAHYYLQSNDEQIKDSCVNILNGILDSIGVHKLSLVHYFDPEADTILLPEEAFNSFVIYYTDSLDSVMGIVSRLHENAYIDFVHPNHLMQFFSVVPDDPKWSVIEPLNGYQDGQLAYMDAMMMPYAWDIQKGCTDIRVAVIDDGFRQLNHPDMSGKYSSWRYDAEEDDYDPRGNNGFHGHHVSSVIGAIPDNNEGIAGIGWNIEVVPVRLGENLEYDEWVRGIDWVVQNNAAKVINISFGAWISKHDDIELSMKTGVENGHIFIAAAGEDGTVLPYPCTSEYTISVGGLIRTWGRDGQSCYGDSLDIMAFSQKIWVANRRTTNQYKMENGTSFAAPMVAGIAALVCSQNPYLNFYQVRNVLTRGAIKLSEMGSSNFTINHGYGLVDAHRALVMVPLIESNIVLSNETVYDLKYVHAQNSIQAGSNFNVLDDAYVEFFAGSQVQLDPGFSAVPSSTTEKAEFIALIKPIGTACSNNSLRMADDRIELDSVKYNESDSSPISIFPNPSNGEFSIKYENAFQGIYEIEVINHMGQKMNIFNQSIELNKVDDSQVNLNFTILPPGVYYIVIYSESREISHSRIIKY
jgi:subtilisin family serine protease